MLYSPSQPGYCFVVGRFPIASIRTTQDYSFRLFGIVDPYKFIIEQTLDIDYFLNLPSII